MSSLNSNSIHREVINGPVNGAQFADAFADGVGANSGLLQALQLDIADTLGLHEESAYDFIVSILEKLGIAESVLLTQTLNIFVTEEVGLSDAVAVAFAVLVEEELGVTDTPAEEIHKIAVLADILRISGVVSNTIDANHVVANALMLYGAVYDGLGFFLTDEVGLNEQLVEARNAVVQALEELALDDSPAATITMLAVIQDETGFEDLYSLNQYLTAAISEGLQLSVIIKLGDNEYTAIVMNTESFGLSEYTNYPFNSFGKIGQTYLGATNTAIYALNGADDAGTDIDTVVRTGLMSFGTNLRKRVPRAYLGYTSDGAMIMKVISTDGGVKTERWYELTARTADSHTGARIKLGRGIKATYWQFELINKLGADFETDSLQLFPMVLSRRV